MKKNIFCLLFISLFHFFLPTPSVASENKITYHLTPSLEWEESETMALEDSVTNYTLKDHQKITMNFTFVDIDLYRDLKKYSLNQLVQNILTGKSQIFSIMDVEIEVLDKKTFTEKRMKGIYLKTRYKLGKNTYTLIEKYYAIPGKTLLTSFRWTTEDETVPELQMALKDFDNISINLENEK